MELSLVDGERLAGLVSISQSIEALQRAFQRDDPELPNRQHLDVGGGDLLVMPAWSDGASGVKLVTVAPGNPERGLPLIHGVYALFEKPSLRPIALFDAAPLTALRTAAVSALATTHMARAESETLMIFGAGVQAAAHLETMNEVLQLTRVVVVSRTPADAEVLLAKARRLGLSAELGTPDNVREADVICTCTTSAKPLFDGALLQPGAHVNAIGSYRPEARELDDRTMERAQLVVDTPTALKESGDLLGPLERGLVRREEVSLLADVLDGSGRRSPEDITVFKSVGAAMQDLAVAEAAAAKL